MKKMKHFFFILLALSCFLFLIAMFAFPKATLMSALEGVSIWWNILFPALFPFFVISEILLGFGIVHFFGTLLDPLMRPFFRVPGLGGFVMTMGFAAGYPVGAKLTAQLWEQKLIVRDEAERLVAFTSTSDPIFLIGAVSVGFFHHADIALILVAAHYGSGILLGLMMRFHGHPTSRSEPLPVSTQQASIWIRAFESMHTARIKDGRAMGTLLRQATESSLKLVFVIGGLVVFFSCFIEMLKVIQVLPSIHQFIRPVLSRLHIPELLSPAIVNGIFEVTLGAKFAGAAAVSLVDKTAVAAFVLSWSGLSVHAQIVSLLSHTNIRYAPFLIARGIHALLSACAVYVLWPVFKPEIAKTSGLVSVWNTSVNHPLPTMMRAWSVFGVGAILFLMALLFLSFLCLSVTNRQI